MALKKWGSERVVAEATLFGQVTDIVALAGGGAVVVWSDPAGDGSSGSIQMQRLDALGNKVGAKTTVNTNTAGNQTGSEAELLADGNFIVVWQHADGFADWEVAFRRFRPDGSAIDAADRFTTNDDRNQYQLGVAAIDRGGFMIVNAREQFDIYVQRVDGAGVPIGSEIPIAVTANKRANVPNIEKLSNGNFVVSWIGHDVPNPVAGDPATWRFQLMRPNGNLIGGPVEMFPPSGDGPSNLTITALTGGGFVASWEAQSGDGDNRAVRAQLFNANGVEVGSEFAINTYATGRQEQPALKALPGGGFVAVYGSDGDIRAQVFTATGAKVGGELLVNLPDNGVEYIVSPRSPDVTVLADGRIAVVWQTSVRIVEGGTAQQRNEIHLQILDPRDGIVNGTINADTLYGNDLSADTVNGLAGNDILFGLAGNDTLRGGAGSDRLDGGAGNDVYDVDSAGDVIVDVSGTDLVRSTVTRTLAAGLENLTLFGTANLNGVGNAGVNVITGNGAANTLAGLTGNDRLIGGAGNDRLDGGAGNDRMEGGAGNDTYVVNAAADVLVDTAGVDTVETAVTRTLATGFENLKLIAGNINGTGNTVANTLTGSAGNNLLSGLAGNDILVGNAGNDTLTGGLGKDVMTGGAGADKFDFNLTTESVRGTNRDVVTDFNRAQGDRIDLSTIDADTDGTAGNQAFIFIGAAAFSGVDGQLRCAGGVIQGDVDGNRVADFEIKVNIATMVAADFML